MAERKPTLCVIAGPNGSGKTTTTEQLLSNEWGADIAEVKRNDNFLGKIGPDNFY